MSAESNDRWGGCNCDQCVADRAAVARVLAATQKSRTTLRREAVQRGEEVPTFDASDQHVRGLNAEEEGDRG